DYIHAAYNTALDLPPFLSVSPAGSVFMCRLCNVFSPSRSQLLAHCSQLHPQQEPLDDIIIALQPLVADPVEKLAGQSTTTSPLLLSQKKTLLRSVNVLTFVQKNDGISGLECRHCHRSFSNRRQILKHICLREEDEDADEEENGEESKGTNSHLKIFACEFCNKIFKFRHSLVAHLRTHTQEKPFQCLHCDYASAIKANLNVHLRKHTGEKFSCQHCPFNCLSPGHLKVHIERVHMKVKQHCGFCEKKYSDVKNLLKHMEKRHNLKDPTVYQSYQQLRLKTRQGLRQLLYHCHTCNRRFKNHLERERHMLVHGPKRPYACLLCDHAVTKMVALSAHVRKHLFLYVCSVCNEKFVSSQRLKSHLTECHPGLDQEQTFTDSINSSYYLAQPGGDMLGSEASMDTQECRIPQEREEDRIREEDGQHGTGGKEWEDNIQSPHLEAGTQKNGHTPAENTHTSSSSSSSGTVTPSDASACTHLSAGPDNSQAAQSEEVNQVFSSLQKTQLNMETFQRLRKIYGELECQYCGKLFWYRVHYNSHVRTHTKEHLHYCSKCSYSSITKSSLKRHQIQKHSGLLLTCSNPDCKYSTPDKYKLQAHMRTHKESETCPVCHRNYPEHRLKHHIKTSHPGKEHTMAEMDGRCKGLMVQRAEKCPYCDSYFLKNSSDFQQHIWAHQGLKPYVCNVCDYAGRSKSNLKTHMNRHNTERRHLCDLCGKKFKSKVTLKSHRLSHTDEGKRFQCSECDFTSVSKPSLLRHMEQHAKFKVRLHLTLPSSVLLLFIF
uniref:Zinc finger and AT hook domain containing n=1 Tax=Neolamprologus brichardi TaxID=32507 RepID=A0A3Q4I0D0_NEOBR